MDRHTAGVGLSEPLEPGSPDDSEVPSPPPTNLWSDEPPMESHLHLLQILVLLDSLAWHWQGREDYFASGNLTVYYSTEQLKTRDFRGPDFFVVLGVDPRPRRSWAVWEEGGRAPDMIVEVLSESTAKIDRGPKKDIYERVLRVPEYFLFDPDSKALEGFRLVNGRYRPITANEASRLESEQLGLELGVHEEQLRFFDRGVLVPRGSEAAARERARAREERDRAEEERARAEGEHARAEEEHARAEGERARAEGERARAEEERARAEEERARADRLAAALRAAGIDPDSV